MAHEGERYRILHDWRWRRFSPTRHPALYSFFCLPRGGTCVEFAHSVCHQKLSDTHEVSLAYLRKAPLGISLYVFTY